MSARMFFTVRVTVLVAILLLASLVSLSYTQSPIATENFCSGEGLSDNLSCKREDGSRECFARSELCNKSPFCKNGLDEGMSQTGLDCDGSLTGRKPNENGEVEPGFLCSNETILNITKMCDGTADCGSGEDETNLLCANKCRGPYYGGCSHTRECESTPERTTRGNCLPGYARDPNEFETGDCLVATFRLLTSNYSLCEGSSGRVSVVLQTAGILDQTVKVNVRTLDSGTATAREDYTVFPRELVFSPFSGGGSIKHFPVRSRYDSSSEGSETFKLEASAEDWPFTQNTTTVTINECSTPTRFLVTVSYSSASENAGVINTNIRLASGVGTLQREVVVDVMTSDYSNSKLHASENVDYNATVETLTFPVGAQGGATLVLIIPLIDDNIAEFNEQFRLTASVRGSGIGIYTGLTHSRSIRITDDDPFIVGFEHTNYTVLEGETVEVCVVNTTNVERVHQYSVQLFTITDHDNNTADATADLDYKAEYGKTLLVFTPESYRECLTIQTYIYNDELNEPVEKFQVQVGRTIGLGYLVQNPLTARVFIENVQVNQVVVSIEEPSYIILIQPESSVEVCVTAENTLDQPINISLQSSYDNKYVTLSPGNLRSCAIFNFPNSLFINHKTDNIRAMVVSDNRRVTLNRSITEVLPQDRRACPQLANPLNGQVDESLSEGLIQQGSIATYFCDVGFVPDGQRFRECLNDSIWSGSPVNCISESPGSLTSSTNQFVLGFISISPFLVVTTDSIQEVFYTVSSDLSSFFGSVDRNFYTSHNLGQTFYAHAKSEPGRQISILAWERIFTPSYSTDCYLSLFTSHINGMNEYEYYSIPFSNPSSLLIVASEDDTRINLPSSSLTLDRFQSHRIDNIRSSSSLRVTSNKPLTVTSAKSCLGQTRNCDFLVEQVLPAHLWGRAFLVASFLGLKTGETIRIIFSKLSTSVTVTCAESNFFHSTIGRGPGQWVDVELDERGRDRFCIIEATDPVYVVQYARESDGESYMMTIPSIDHYGGFFQGFYAPSFSPYNFVTLYITPENFVPGVAVSVDGVPVINWEAVRCLNDSLCGYIARPILSRQAYHTVVHTNPRAQIGVSAYGYDTFRKGSYGYPVSLQIQSDQGMDECLPQLDICGSNAECAMDSGHYLCVCNLGYQRFGKTLLCIDVNECDQSSSICNLNARCTNTVGGFTCTCNEGFIGTGRQCTRESSLVPFKDYIPFTDLNLAKKTSGSFNNLEDDECRLVRLDFFIPIGGTRFSQAWICDNGVISLGDRPFKIWRPQLFPSDNPLISRSNVLAIFWNDHQPASVNSRVSYQLFDKGTFDEVRNVNSFVSDQLGGRFEGNWMMVVSWENVVPFLHRPSGRTPQNSYQAVIITDFRNTYAIFIYDSNRLEWFGTGAQRNVYSVVGYNFDQRVASSLSNIPSFQNHRLSGTPDVDGISDLNLRERVQWSNVIYHIGNDVVTGIISFAECKSIETQDISLFSNLGVRLEQDLACPCSINQAFQDKRYVYASRHLSTITGDSRFNSRNCFVQVFQPSINNRGVHLCCYSTSEQTFGDLFNSTFGAEASSSLRFHPYSEPNQYVEFDYHFYESCCLNFGGECKVYTDQRKADDCETYTPSSSGR